MSQIAADLEARIRAKRLVDLPVSWGDEVVFPNYDGLSIQNAAATVGAAFGLDGSTVLDDAIWAGESPVGKVDRVLLFMVDGLGYKFLQQMIAEDEAFAKLVVDLSGGRGALPLTSVAPSTTAAALPTMWTAAPPGAHGMVGTNFFLRDLGLIADMLHFKPADAPLPDGVLTEWGGFTPEHFIPLPTLGELFTQTGIATHLVLRNPLIGTGLSRIMHRGVQHSHAFLAFSDLWLRLRDVLRETSGKKAYINVYWELVDAMSHFYGANNETLRNEVKMLFSALRDVLNDPQGRDGKTLVMIMSDHGHHDALESIELERDAVLLNALRVRPYGDSRFGYWALRSGMQKDVTDYLAQKYADKLLWLDVGKALDAGLFGRATHPELRHRMGDLIVVPRLNHRLDFRVKKGTFRTISKHAGLSDHEMLVPLLWSRM